MTEERRTVLDDRNLYNYHTMIEFTAIPKFVKAQSSLREAARKTAHGYFINDQQVADIVSKQNYTLVGYGSECVVVSSAGKRWWELNLTPLSRPIFN